MPQAVENLASAVEQLSERLLQLEGRIADLESLVAAQTNRSSAVTLPTSGSFLALRNSRTPSGPLQPRPAGTRLSFRDVETSSALSAVGKAALGFAGAFLLRALAESGSLPKLPVLIVAIIYACAWMVWSTRTVDRFASVSYALTSALILSPLLWEATIRFGSLSPVTSAGILVAFVVLTVSLASRRQLQVTPWIAVTAGVSTDIALIIGTRELLSLTLALLAIAAATELYICLNHAATFRVIPCITADFGVWLAIYILGSENVPEGYSPVAPAKLMLVCVLLPAIYGSSIGFRTFIRRGRIGVFEITQTMLSFALGAYGMMTASRNAAAPAIGLAFLLLATLCYWGTLWRFAATVHTRNRRVSATWAAALLLAATFMLLPGTIQVPFLCAAALLTAVLYTHTANLSLGLHASFYLASAAAASSLAIYVWNALAGTMPASPDWRAWVVASTAAICYGVESRHEVDEGRRRLLWLVPSGIVAFTIAGWAVATTVRLVAGRFELAASHLSTIRTVVICVLALALGMASRRRHIELRWIAYAAVALGTLKLILEDLRFGNPASLVVSFVFYGSILIALPRLTRANKEGVGTGLPAP